MDRRASPRSARDDSMLVRQENAEGKSRKLPLLEIGSWVVETYRSCRTKCFRIPLHAPIPNVAECGSISAIVRLQLL